MGCIVIHLQSQKEKCIRVTNLGWGMTPIPSFDGQLRARVFRTIRRIGFLVECMYVTFITSQLLNALYECVINPSIRTGSVQVSVFVGLGSLKTWKGSC